MSPCSAYDRLAPHYRRYAEARRAYLDAVNRFVLAHAVPGARMLDVGAGDGVRGVEIARALGAVRIVLCEPSEAMAALCRAQPVDEVWQAPAEALPATEQRFEIITCLWNVLGHLADRDARIRALAAMRSLLAPDGRVYCDVNNRHNARAYGQARVLLRRIVDGIAQDDRRGDSTFEWRVAGERIPAQGHLFTPREMRAIVAEAGLEIERQVAVDYVSGAVAETPWDGQLVYQLRRPRVRPGNRRS